MDYRVGEFIEEMERAEEFQETLGQWELWKYDINKKLKNAVYAKKIEILTELNKLDTRVQNLADNYASGKLKGDELLATGNEISADMEIFARTYDHEIFGNYF